MLFSLVVKIKMSKITHITCRSLLELTIQFFPFRK